MRKKILNKKTFIIFCNIAFLIVASIWVYSASTWKDRLEPIFVWLGLVQALILIYYFEEPNSIDIRVVNKLISSTLGYKYKSQNTEIFLNSTGGFTQKNTYTIEVTADILSHVSHRFTFLSGIKTQNLGIDVTTNSSNNTIILQPLSQTKESAYFDLMFSPALTKGEILEYTTTERSDTGYLMTLEEVSKRIGNQTWPIKGESEFSAIRIKTEIEKFSFKVIFPKHFPVEGSEFWDITNSSNLKQSLSSLKSSDTIKFHKTFDQNGCIVLHIEDSQPMIDVRYLLKWIPPTRQKYLDFLAIP